MAHFIMSVLFQSFHKTSTAVHLNQPSSYSQITSHWLHDNVLQGINDGKIRYHK